MRGILKFGFVVVFVFCLFIGQVAAEEAAVGTLIPVGSGLDVTTNHFYYSSVRFNGSTLDFSVRNLGKVKAPVSISVGLFDASEKNVGMINYCSSKDYDSSFANVKLAAGAQMNYSIAVKSKYFGEKKSLKDVQYIAVINDNSYCKIGGASNYIGKTVTDILPKNSVADIDTSDNNNAVDDILDKILGKFTLFTIVYWFFIFGVYFIFSTLLNTLCCHMYRRGTLLAWIPFVNVYLCVKLSFGQLIAIIYSVITLICGLLSINVMMNLLSMGASIGFIVVLIKLLTKKYNLFIIGGYVKLPSSNKSFSKSYFDKAEKKDNVLVDFMKKTIKRQVLDDIDEEKDDDDFSNDQFTTSPFNWNKKEDKNDDDDLGQFL